MLFTEKTLKLQENQFFMSFYAPKEQKIISIRHNLTSILIKITAVNKNHLSEKISLKNNLKGGKNGKTIHKK